MKEKKSSDKPEMVIQPKPLTQAPMIRDAITYIVDKQGNEIKADRLSQIADPPPEALRRAGGGKEEDKP